jgi:hypothetical protein
MEKTISIELPADEAAKLTALMECALPEWMRRMNRWQKIS